MSLLFFSLLWFILFLLLLSKITINFSSFIFSLSTLLIFTHIIYGGRFLFKKEKRIDLPIFLLVFLIYVFLIFFISDISYPFFWFFWLIAIFLVAITFHSYYKLKITQVYLQEFCNYKLYIEIGGVVLSCLGILFSFLFPGQKAILGILILIFIIKFNFSIFRKKRLYDIYYQAPVISKVPFISIVIIAYNEEEYIGKLLESLRLQDWPNYEIIVVDDHSTDRTVQVAKGFESVLPLKIVQKDIRGISRSRNYGASFAQGEIILFLDADVMIPPGFITKNIEIFIEKKLSIAGVDFIAITDNKIDKLITGFYRKWLKVVQYFNPRGIGICLFVQKELHQKVLFDHTIVMSEDFDYVKRASQHGKFRILDAVCLKVSWRRFHKENRLLLIFKYIFFEWYRQNVGEIRRKILPYEFGTPNPAQK